MIVHKDINLKNSDVPIGEGGMAKVYLAYHHSFKCDVAVKVLNKEFVYNDHVRSRFIDEARKLFLLNHPQIIRVTEIIEEDDLVAFVMEYINGKTLKQYIDSKDNMSTIEIVELYNQMLDSLIYIHQKNIIHRDIKPSNFMITTEGGIKLLDFGISKSNERNNNEYTGTSANAQMGTPMYMSPEQINDSSSVTNQSDIYSIGVVLWCMVTGKKPYDDSSISTFQIFSKIVNESLEPTNSIFQPIIDKCTEKNLLKRYKDCKEIKKDIRKLLEKEENKTIVYNYKTGGKTVSFGQETIFANNSRKATGLNLNQLLKNTKVRIGLGVFMIMIVTIIIALSKSSDSTSTTEAPTEPPVQTETPTTITEKPVAPIEGKKIETPAPVDNSAPTTVIPPGETKIKVVTPKQKPVKKNPTTVQNPQVDQKIDESVKETPKPTTTKTEENTKPEEGKKEPKWKKRLKEFKEEVKKTFKKQDEKNGN
jgi:serine/threonine protein kinase